MVRKVKKGIVVSVLEKKFPVRTCIVAVTNYTKHPFYKKVVPQTKRYAVETHGFSVQLGDQVSIGETRPLSRTKRWSLLVTFPVASGIVLDL